MNNACKHNWKTMAKKAMEIWELWNFFFLLKTYKLGIFLGNFQETILLYL